MIGACIGAGPLVVASCVRAAEIRDACVQYHGTNVTMEGKNISYRLLMRIRTFCIGLLSDSGCSVMHQWVHMQEVGKHGLTSKRRIHLIKHLFGSCLERQARRSSVHWLGMGTGWLCHLAWMPTTPQLGHLRQTASRRSQTYSRR